MAKKKMTAEKIMLCGLFAALTAVLAQISIPIGLIPINFANVAVFLSAGILGGKLGAVSQIIYVLTGVIGLPVFSGFMGGIGRILGPTGGYIVAYIIVALVVGSILQRRCENSWMIMFTTMYTGWLIQYVLGTAWYCIQMETGVIAALSVCVLPFLAGDFAKTVVSIIAIKKIKKPLSKIMDK